VDIYARVLFILHIKAFIAELLHFTKYFELVRLAAVKDDKISKIIHETHLLLTFTDWVFSQFMLSEQHCAYRGRTS
jgi:hypothetical protein